MKADVVGMVVVSVDVRCQLNDRLGAYHHGVGVAQVSVVVAAGLVGPNAHPHLRVALGDHIGEQRRLCGVDTHLVVGRCVQISVGVAVCPIAEDIFAPTVGRRRGHKHIIRRIPTSIGANTVEAHGEVGERRFIGILNAVFVRIQPDSVADLQGRRFADHFHIAETAPLPEGSQRLVFGHCQIPQSSAIARQAADIDRPVRVGCVERVHHGDRNLACAFHDSDAASLRVVMKAGRIDTVVKLASIETELIHLGQPTPHEPLGDIAVTYLTETQGIAARCEERGFWISLIGRALVR